MYIIKKNKKESTIIYMEYDDPSYEIKVDPKLKINNLYVYDKKYLPNKDNLPFEYIFQEVANKVFAYVYSDVDDDDDSDSSFDTLLGEVDRIKNLLESQYKEFLKRQEYYAYVEKLSFLKEEIYNKAEIIKYNKTINQLLSGKSR